MPKPNYQKNNRVRIFGGPNGSGKSTILFEINDRFDLGVYINADIIENELRENQRITLTDYGVEHIENHFFQEQIDQHSIVAKAKKDGYPIDLLLENDVIINPDKVTHSYEAAFIADFLRKQLLKQGRKFSFETVMSHSSKLNFMEQANQKGYKVYLYFICTESPIINENRVNERVAKGGHPVANDKIKSRYYNSLNLLKEAVALSYRAFIFDNSKDRHQLILEVYQGEDVTYHYDEIPLWVDEYLLQSKIR